MSWSEGAGLVHHSEHFLAGFMKEPTGHENASEKAGAFCSGPSTLKSKHRGQPSEIGDPALTESDIGLFIQLVKCCFRDAPPPAIPRDASHR